MALRAVVGMLLASMTACSDRSSPPAKPPPSPLETNIAGELAKRYGVTLAVTCRPDGTGCTAHAPGIAVPIRVARDASAIDWHVDGIVVRVDAIASYVHAELTELGAATSVACGPPLVVVQAGERIQCDLGNGGKAFATIADDGSTTFEIHVDPASANARAERETAEREQQLIEQSRQLDVDYEAADEQ